MTPPDHNEYLDLTAYALGELEADEASRVKQYLASSPQARAEYVRIEHAIAALKKTSALPKARLNPRQRETVLAMGQRPSQNAKVITFPRSHGRSNQAIWSVAKYAAAACLAAGAFVLGQKTSTQDKAKMAEQKSDKTAIEAPTSVKAEATPAVAIAPEVTSPSKDTAMPVVDSKVSETPKVEVATITPAPPALVEKAPEVIVPPTTAIPVEKTLAPVVAQVAPKSLKSFTLAASQPEASIYFQPRLVKPVPHVFAGNVLFSSPMPLNSKSLPVETKRKIDQPQLLIHSWRAEIASCPWDASRRLMRLVTQVPVDQPAVDLAEGDYKLVAKFDPALVQGYRLVAEKHLPASNGANLATRFAWYEIIPAKNYAPTQNKPANIGSFEVVQPRKNGATSRDSGALRLTDRGLNWNETREDYVFETAMIGFSLLLQGTENVGELNHRLVLDIAQQSKGEDPKGERAKFIKVVKQAQSAAGL